MQVVPTILTDSLHTFQEQLDIVRQSSHVEAVQVDVIDGMFADNITITPLDITLQDFDPLKIDFHLMVEEPMDFVFECEPLKRMLPIRRIIGQVERMSYQQDFLQQIKKNGWEAGLALDLYTPIEAIEEESWADMSCILLLAVEAGAQGQEFNDHVLEKIKEVRLAVPNHKELKILVDGGLRLSHARDVIQAGADEFDIGSAIWHDKHPLEAIEEFYHLDTHA